MAYPSPMEEEEVLPPYNDPREVVCPTCRRPSGEPCWQDFYAENWTWKLGFHRSREEAYKRLKTQQLLLGESDA